VTLDPIAEQDIPNTSTTEYITPIDDQSIASSKLDTHLVNATEADTTTTISLETQVWPVMFDLNDDGRVSFGDLAFFADAFGSTVDDLATPNTFASDFDHSAVVSFGDLSFFAENFGLSRDDPQRTIVPLNFPTDWLSNALRAKSPSPVEPAEGQRLTNLELQTIVEAAFIKVTANATPESSCAIRDISFEITDLPGKTLGRATSTTITIDADAAGLGWFIDTTPLENEEFSIPMSPTELAASADSLGHDRYDLLTVVMHELGHVLGRQHEADATQLMNETISPGIRRLASDVFDATTSSLRTFSNDNNSDVFLTVWSDLHWLSLI
jgi:hypothetical protein